MKKSIQYLLILTLLFAAGCSTQGEVQSLNLDQASDSIPDGVQLPGDGPGGIPGGGGVGLDPNRLRLDPPSLVIGAGKSATFEALKGTAPFTFSIYLGDGSVVAATGAFTAPVQAGNTILKVKDANGNTAYANIQITESPKIFPSQVNLAQSNIYNFSVVGGRSPYTYSLVGGQGVIDSITGQYKAPAFNGSATVRVTDASGNTSDAVVNVSAGLSISPNTITLPIGTQAQFAAAGGVGSITYTVAANEGLIDPNTGDYMAPSKVGAYAVRATDSLGNSVSATVIVVNKVEANPKKVTLNVSGSFTFAATGGKAPFFYTALNGAIDTNSGLYTAPAATGTDTITVKDATGAISTAEVVVVSNGALTISNTVLTQGASGTLNVTGVTYPLTSCVFSPAGDGTCNLTNGSYTAPSTAGTYTLAITDSTGKSATTTIVVNEPLDLTPASPTLAVGGQLRFAGKGGVPPYNYSLFSGDGDINGSSGDYYASNSSGGATIKVTDSKGNSKTTSVTVVAKLAMTPPSTTLGVGQELTFAATGGVAPYTFQVDRGQVDATGKYTAPLSAGNAILRAQDSLGNAALASITVQDGMTLLPQQVSIVKNSSIKFDVVSGKAPFVFTIDSGSGAIDNQGYYQAADSIGEVIIKVVDANNEVRTAKVSVVDNVTINPFYKIVSQGSSVQMTATGGVAPYTFELEAGGPGGTLTSQNGNTITFNAPNTDGYQGVKVTDATGGFATGYLIVQKPLSLASDHNPLAVGNQLTLTASGGVPPYNFTVDPISAGDMTRTASTKADFVAGGTPQDVTMRVTDAEGSVAIRSITITGPLSLNPTGLVMVPNQSKNIQVSGGVPPYTARVVSGGGTIAQVDSSTFSFTAPNSGSSVQIEVSDGMSNRASLVASVFSSLLIQPSNPYIGPNLTQVFTVTGGSGTFAFALNPTSGKGTFNSGTKTYTAPTTVPATSPMATLTVTDSLLGVSANTNINIRDAVAVDLVTSSTPDGLYGIGQQLNVLVKFKESVIVDTRYGIPFIEIKFGSTIRNANYVSGSGSSFLSFSYSVTDGDTTTDLNYNATTSLKLNGGTIKDTLGMPAVLTLPATNDATKSLGGAKAIQTDGARSAAVLTGAPSNYSNLNSYSIVVGGAGIVEYKSKYGVAATVDCILEAGYSEATPIAANIAIDLNSISDGPLKLCVVGKTAVGNWQLLSSATMATWTKDTVAPAPPTNFADGLDQGGGNVSPIATWTASVEDSLSPIHHYELAIGTVAGGTTIKTWTNVGNVTTANIANFNMQDGLTYYGSIVAVDAAGNKSTVVQGDGWVYQGISCPTGYVFVPEDSDLDQRGFCVAKYEMKNSSGAVSQAAGLPWSGLNKLDASLKCKAAGMDLITNAQWKQLAKNIIMNPPNWNSGEYNVGFMARGHSDNSPSATLAAADDSDPYNGTGQSASDAYGVGGEQKRIFVLSTGAVIWDLAGNAREMLADEVYAAELSPVPVTSTIYAQNDATFFPVAGFNTNLLNYTFRFHPSINVGKYTGGNSGAISRGGRYNDTDASGVLAANMTSSPYNNTDSGFRCATASLKLTTGNCAETAFKNTNVQLQVSGGISPYFYSVVSGAASVNSSGLLAVGNTTQSIVVRVTDSVGSIYNLKVFPVSNAISLTSNSQTGTQSFAYTGSVQNFVVPNGVYVISAQAWGAGGSGGQVSSLSYRSYGGAGGYVKSLLMVTPGETLKVVVGAKGAYVTTLGKAGSGGGASAILKEDFPLVIAGGGGGGGDSNAYGWGSFTSRGGAGGQIGQKGRGDINNSSYEQCYGLGSEGGQQDRPGFSGTATNKFGRKFTYQPTTSLNFGGGFIATTGAAGYGGGFYTGGEGGNAIININQGGTCSNSGVNGGAGGGSSCAPVNGNYLDGSWTTPGGTTEPGYTGNGAPDTDGSVILSW